MSAASQSTDQNEKLNKVLQLFLLPDYTIASTTYLDILLSHIAKHASNRSPAEKIASNRCFRKWVVEALNTWTVDEKPCQPLIVFTLKLVGIIGADEFNFLYWYRGCVFEKMNTIFALRDANLHPSVKMAYTGMLLEFINHGSGRKWIIETGAWKDVIKFCHANHTLYVTRESQKFVWKLLLLMSEDKTFCEEVIYVAAEPLIKNTFSPQLSSALEDNYLDQNELLLTIIDLLTVIIENTLFVSLDNTIPNIIDSVTNLETRIKGLFETCISTKFYAHIMKLMYLLLFMRLKEGLNSSGEMLDSGALNTYFMNCRYIDSMLVTKMYVLDMIKGAKLLVIYWHKFNSLWKVKVSNFQRPDLHSLMVMVIPLFTCMVNQNPNEDIMEMFIQKLFNITCMYTQRLCYMLRDGLRREGKLTEHVYKVAVQTVIDIVDIIGRDGAVIIFQVMSYVLMDYVQSSNCNGRLPNSVSPKKENPRIPKFQKLLEGDPLVQRPILLSALLDGLSVIIHKFKLKWQDCLETINILSLTQNILNHRNVAPKVCVQALSLCKLAIQNFMAPNLALLVHSDGRSDELGPVLFKRLHDPNWEIRDSVLEVIYTIATISEDKYPAFQDLLLEIGFPQVIFDIAATDGESYVRATALTCITTFVRIDRIWNEHLCHKDLLKMAINLMSNESEAIVRREAVTLVKELYVHRKWPKSTVDEMAQAMSAAAVLDLHWEVKVNALQFWRQFIKSHFSDQGMLDGGFPTVTFSKENRKIVALNKDEIRRRVLKALDELANENCLGILLATLEDDSDFQVCKASGEIIKVLQGIFTTYEIREPEAEALLSSEINIEEEELSQGQENWRVSDNDEVKSSKVEQHSIPMDIIDSIVDADDMNLLASVYNHTMNVSTDSKQPSSEQRLDSIRRIKRSQFLHFVLDCNIDAYIEEKSRWLKTYTNSFDSVIDDILVTHESKNVNDMDCY